MNHSKVELEFRKSLEDTDYGLIVGADGDLKGIWVPETMEDQDIPDAVVNLCVSKFGINPTSQDEVATIQ
jgi:hypothetical protein|tara:strand:+ start:318 stop:527 length:210 start_codon:yes stop_codon:yes gene_type:complete